MCRFDMIPSSQVRANYYLTLEAYTLDPSRPLLGTESSVAWRPASGPAPVPAKLETLAIRAGLSPSLRP